MSSEWIRTSIGQQATLQRGFDITKAEQRVGDVPVVSSAGISSWHDTAMVKGPGVVLGRKGVVGSVHFIQQDFWPHDTSLWVKDFHGNDPRYVYYFFRANAKALSALDVGSANPTLNRNHVHPIEVSWPSSQGEQWAIAGILATLDDRITLLRETNATLEAIAQALFKSWFVDFDPVRAKQAGRTPEGMDEATATLFPDSFEESELGLVPKGWRVVRLDSVVELSYGKALKAENRKAGPVPVYGSGGITGWHDQALVEQPAIIVGRKGTVGSLYWESRPFFPIDTVFYVKSRKPLTYCYLLLNTLGLDSMNTDAAVPGLNRENVYRLLVTEPPESILAAFDSVTSVLRASMDENKSKAQTLATLRDSLLPRLISGQLRLPEAEMMVEEATGPDAAAIFTGST